MTACSLAVLNDRRWIPRCEHKTLLPRGASGGLAHELLCDADATKPQLVNFLGFLDQDVSGTDRPEVSRAHGKNLALPLIRGVTDPRQCGQRRAGNDAALAGVNLATRAVDQFEVVALLERQHPESPQAQDRRQGLIDLVPALFDRIKARLG